MDDENGSFPDFVHAGNHITNQSEKEDECSENVKIASVLFLASNTKDDTKEDLLFCPNQLPSSEYLLGKNGIGIYMKEREKNPWTGDISDLYPPVSQKQDRIFFYSFSAIQIHYHYHLLFSVGLADLIYFVAGRSPAPRQIQNLYFHVYAQDFGPGNFCKWYALIPLFVHLT